MRRDLLCGVILCVAGLTGCWSLPPSERYGPVIGRESLNSLNGLAVHRELWEQAGARCFQVAKLSPRLEEFDVIVLVGDSFAPPGRRARQWLMDWVAAKENRKVIYFGRDFDAAVYYRQQTLDAVAPQLRQRAQEEIARRQIQNLAARMQEIDENAFAEWFYVEVTRPTISYTRFAGQWAAELDGLAGSWPVRTVLHPPHRRWKRHLPSHLQQAASDGTQATVETGTSGEESASEVIRSVWRRNEFGTLEQWEQAFQHLLPSKVLLAADDGTPLIFRLRVPHSSNGEILVLVNGAPLLNASAVQPLHRRIAERLVSHCLPARRVAFVPFDEAGILISNVSEPDTRAIGLEMLTVWPLSAITMTFSSLCILLCAALLPIFGRPRKLPRRTVTDFGLHVEALGELLRRTSDKEFAMRAIRDYFVVVRNESPPDWITLPPVPAKRATPQRPSTEDSVSEPTGASARTSGGATQETQDRLQ